MAAAPIWLKHSGSSLPHYPTSPNCWQGEVGCVIGPFSSKSVAETFVNVHTEARYDAIMDHVFPNRDAWYIEVRALKS